MYNYLNKWFTNGPVNGLNTSGYKNMVALYLYLLVFLEPGPVARITYWFETITSFGPDASTLIRLSFSLSSLDRSFKLSVFLLLF